MALVKEHGLQLETCVNSRCPEPALRPPSEHDIAVSLPGQAMKYDLEQLQCAAISACAHQANVEAQDIVTSAVQQAGGLRSH